MKNIKKEIRKLKKAGLYRKLRTVKTPQGPYVKINGKKVLLLCSNDYLNLANHPEVKEAAIAAINKYGFGSGASRLISGTMPPHRELEERIAAFKGTEAALLFNSGYAANTGVIQSISEQGDIIYSDRLNHASIVDGCIVSRAEVRRYRHQDMEALERFLINDTEEIEHGGRRLIVTDGVFSMDGDIAQIYDIVKLAGDYDAMVMVDDAHGTGVLGLEGRGTAEYLSIDSNKIDIHMGTLGKALGASGAYIAGTQEMINYLTNRARSFIFTTALPPSTAAAALAALGIIEREPERRERLMQNAAFMRKGLQSLGFETLQSMTQIIPVLTGDPGPAVQMMEDLLKEGIYVQAIRPPSVMEGTSRLRVTVTAGHSRDDLERALGAIGKAGKKAGLI